MTVELIEGDSREVLREFEDNSIDSCVTDPPYALVSISKRFGKEGSAAAKVGKTGAYARASAGFMGKTWDTGETAFDPAFWEEVLRVLKPGGHVVAFGGTRTYHRLACAIEDAGFEIRDRIRFDQSFDTKFGPLFDSLNDAQREALLELLSQYGDGGSEQAWLYGSGFPKSHNQSGDWEGWGTALKPAWEPICLARKPLAGTVAGNLAEWGVGALNIDGCRVAMGEGEENPSVSRRQGAINHLSTRPARETEAEGRMASRQSPEAFRAERAGELLGRWPANIIHDGSDEVLAAFPQAPGQMARSSSRERRADQSVYGAMHRGGEIEHEPRDNGGSAARFFYCAKASKKDRDHGLAAFDTKITDVLAGHRSRRMEEVKRPDGAPPATGKNTHPTVKPTDLMRYLCRLVTPPGGTVLDPFMGSGSTGRGAVMEGFSFIGIEMDAGYYDIADARIAAVEPKAEAAE